MKTNAIASLFVISGIERCWKCGACEPVIALGLSRSKRRIQKTPEVILSYIEELPDSVVLILNKISPSFHRQFYQSEQLAYLENHCYSCGSNFGDGWVQRIGGILSPANDSIAPHLVIIGIGEVNMAEIIAIEKPSSNGVRCGRARMFEASWVPRLAA